MMGATRSRTEPKQTLPCVQLPRQSPNHLGRTSYHSRLSPLPAEAGQPARELIPSLPPFGGTHGPNLVAACTGKCSNCKLHQAGPPKRRTVCGGAVLPAGP